MTERTSKGSYVSVHKTVGVLGGGQLGRMMSTAANDLGVCLVVLDPTPNSPAGQVCKQIVGKFTDATMIKELAQQCDLLTVEIEHVNCDGLDCVQANTGISVQPTSHTIRLIQDKYTQKQHLRAHGIAVVDYIGVNSAVEVKEAGNKWGYPIMLKARTMAHDGRGNAVVKGPEGVDHAMALLGGQALYVERWLPFTKELAIMVVRGLDGEVELYPVVETIQVNNICHTVLAPAQINDEIKRQAQDLAKRTVEVFEGAGVYGVEMFLSAEGKVVVNEVAPRTHNSGHYTIEACHTSQFENHLRAILGLPLGDTSMRVPAALMVNVLGASQDMEETWTPFTRALAHRAANLHWYGKAECKLGRKMGHITLVGPSLAYLLKEGTGLGLLNTTTLTAPLPSSHPLVGVIMGSDSDLPVMRACCTVLQEFGVPFECTIVSAHRTPDRLVSYAHTARSKGLKVIIAAAGGAAHLPGMTAAMTSLPVIGVPIALRHLDGVDSLYSICQAETTIECYFRRCTTPYLIASQMPRGVPVATVAIDNPTNAALLAVRMIGVEQSYLLDAMEGYQKQMEVQVQTKIDTLATTGWRMYGEKQ